MLGIHICDFRERRRHELISQFSEAGFSREAPYDEIVQIEPVRDDARAGDQKSEELDVPHRRNGVGTCGVVDAPGAGGKKHAAIVLFEIAGAFELHGHFQKVLIIVASFEFANDAVTSRDNPANSQVTDVTMLDSSSERFIAGSLRTEPAHKLPQRILPKAKLLRRTHIIG